MNKDDWEELLAQVDDHGPEAIQFYLSSDASDGSDLDLYVIKLFFEDGEIKVVLE